MGATRRGLLLGGVSVLAAGCSGSSSDGASSATADAGSSTTRSASPSATPSSTGPTPAALPDVSPWRPGAGELVPACKLAAVRRVEGAGNGRDTALQVIDAQYGGLLTDTASVLVVTRAWRRTGQKIVHGGHTYDVRLSGRAGPGGSRRSTRRDQGPPRADLTPTARRVLASDRIHLPPAATADIRSGQVHDSALAALLTVARPIVRRSA